MKLFRTFLLILIIAASLQASAQAVQDAQMNRFITSLMAKMTLDEKIGQLNLPSSGDITTGQASSSNIAEKIREGKEDKRLRYMGIFRMKKYMIY